MFNAKERKQERLANCTGAELSVKSYNLLIGLVLLYGFFINAVIVKFATPLFAEMNPWTLLIGYFISCLIGALIVNISHSPIISFLGYNLIVVPLGAVLSLSLPSFPAEKIIAAAVITGTVTFLMMLLSISFPNFFSKLGLALFLSLLIGVIVEFIAMLLGYGGSMFDWFFVVIFSLYIGYDWNRAQQYYKSADNAVDSAVDLYLDIINVFLRILSLIGRKD